MSHELKEKIVDILNKANLPERYTKFQVEKFIIGKEPTGQAQLWQCIRELSSRKEAVDMLEKDLKDAEDNLELFDLKIERLNRQIRQEAETETTFTDLNIQEHEINIRKFQRERDSLCKSAQKAKRKLSQQLEEIQFLIEIYEKIVSQVGDIASLDDEEAQREMWNEKYLEEFTLRILLQRPLDPDFVRCVMSLDENAPVRQHLTKSLAFQKQKMLIREEK